RMAASVPSSRSTAARATRRTATWRAGPRRSVTVKDRASRTGKDTGKVRERDRGRATARSIATATATRTSRMASRARASRTTRARGNRRRDSTRKGSRITRSRRGSRDSQGSRVRASATAATRIATAIAAAATRRRLAQFRLDPVAERADLGQVRELLRAHEPVALVGLHRDVEEALQRAALEVLADDGVARERDSFAASGRLDRIGRVVEHRPAGDRLVELHARGDVPLVPVVAVLADDAHLQQVGGILRDLHLRARDREPLVFQERLAGKRRIGALAEANADVHLVGREVRERRRRHHAYFDVRILLH